MKCEHCDRYRQVPCSRQVCGVSDETLAAFARQKAEERALRKAERDKVLAERAAALAARKAITRNFKANYAKVAEWSERQGWQRPEDRALLESWAGLTYESQYLVTELARSL